MIILARILPDGREASVVPLTFGRARLVAGPTATRAASTSCRRRGRHLD